MKAVVITSYGGVEGIGVQEVETPPAPTADRVRVRVHAAGLNRADILQRRGHYPAPPGYPTNIPGLEFAGGVESVGQEVRTWKIGDRVFGITGGGEQAEFVSVAENNLAAITGVMGWVHAAGLFVSARRRARNRRSTSDCSCENERRLSARCFAGARSKKKPRPRGALPLPFSRWCRAARFVQSSIVFIRQTKSAMRMHVWNPMPALAESC